MVRIRVEMLVVVMVSGCEELLIDIKFLKSALEALKQVNSS